MLNALDVGYAIKDRRQELGLTQSQVAAAANVSERCLWSLEMGKNPGVRLDRLLAVFEALGLDLDITERTTSSNARATSKGGWDLSELGTKDDVPFDPIAILTSGARSGSRSGVSASPKCASTKAKSDE